MGVQIMLESFYIRSRTPEREVSREDIGRSTGTLDHDASGGGFRKQDVKLCFEGGKFCFEGYGGRSVSEGGRATR